MKYMIEYGFKVYPVNPSAKGEKILGEEVYAKITDINKNVDIVDLLLSKQLESWRKTTNKDNRINANMSTKMLDDNNVPYEQILY